MKTFFADLPFECLCDLKTHTTLIRRYANPEMILLFGNYAGDDLAPASVIGYDLAVLTAEACVPTSRDIKRYLYRNFPQQERYVKTVHIYTFPLSLFNAQVISGNWFFYRLRKHGVILHGQGEIQLSDRKRVDCIENAARSAKACDVFLPMAKELYENAAHHLQNNSLRCAAINLCMALEQAFRGCYAVMYGILPPPMQLIDYQDSISSFTEGLDNLLDRSDSENNSMLFRIVRLKNLARYNLPFDSSEAELADYLAKTKSILDLLKNASSRHIAYLQHFDEKHTAELP